MDRMDVDGSVYNQHQAACGGVIRNSQGHWLMGFYKSLGISSVTEAEIHAIMTGLTVARHMGLQRAILYSDSLDAINTIMRNHYADHPFRDTIREIRDFLLQDWSVEIRHMPRENIAYADYMAKLGQDVTNVVDVVLIPIIPTGCLPMVLRDQLACNY
ncbi:hypothetical protein QN277_001587 [Acacia crassicarpa]|uniref:RNase H type-1 domain-containing protein n=1 Tax=Acacia crassicarpa TaxID=499986 RepID=A0AAE1N7F2_9FABA|nr:hypothetical protein QN277_001587 [Acacia crassicarpa]